MRSGRRTTREDPVPAWQIDRIISFGPDGFSRDGFVHFGFHDRAGNQYGVEHQKHFLGLVGERDTLTWTVAAYAVFDGVPNIRAESRYPMYIDSMPDGTLVVSNFGNARLYRIDVGGWTPRSSWMAQPSA